MQDDRDPHASIKFPSRPLRQPTGPSSPDGPVSRAPTFMSMSHDQIVSPSSPTSAAAVRYSPLTGLSPTSPLTAKSVGIPIASLPPQHQQAQLQSPLQFQLQPALPLSQFSQDSALSQSSTRQQATDFSNPQQSPYLLPRQFYNHQHTQLPPLSPYLPQISASQSSISGFRSLPPSGPASATLPSSVDHYPQALDNSFPYGSDPRVARRNLGPAMSFPSKGPVPEFKKIRQFSDLRPKKNFQPLFRRADPEGGFISPLQALTVHLPSTYRICNPNFKYESSRNPRRVLTKPSKGVKNDGYDNEDSDYILYVNDILGSEEAGHKNRYLILDVLGQGTFGQVVKCQNLKTQEVVAVKVIKNRTAYFNQSMMEVSVLDLLNTKLDKNDDHHLLRLKDTFIHRQHLCLVFELLSVNLYELIKQNQFRGLSTTLVRVFAQQLLNGLALLNKARLIHCDLKPENILLKNLESPIIKIIDFGSACDERQTVYTYIQSRFYRSPEVLLGLPYSSAIDMWSLGCIVVELFLGLPLFPGSSEYNQVARIVEMLGNPPNWMIEMGKQGSEFFEKRQDEFGRRTYHLKSMEQYSREHSTKEQPSKKYFQASTLPQIMNTYPMPRKDMKQSEIDREMSSRVAFIDFVRGLLTINPLERWSPQQAKLHPFITQQKFNGPFVPPMNLKSSSLNRSPAPGVQQQLQAEAVCKQRAQAAQAQASSAAQNAYAVMNYEQYQQPAQPVYAGVPAYGQTPTVAKPPPPYEAGPSGQMAMAQSPQQINNSQYGNVPQPTLYPSGTRTGRQRASTMEQQQSCIPPAIQRVASQLDPNHPIRLQPSPAYYPPPADGLAGSQESTPGRSGRRGSRAQPSLRGRDFIRNLEERSLEEGIMGSQNAWH